MRVLLLVTGYTTLAIGVIGLVAPILPGWMLIFVGLFILAKYAVWARRVLDWFKSRHPRVRRVIDRAQVVSTRWIRIITVRLGRRGSRRRAMT